MTAETDRARDATGVRRANLPPRTMNLNFTIMVVTTENKKKSRGFLSGLNQLRVGDYKIAVTEIKSRFGNK